MSQYIESTLQKVMDMAQAKGADNSDLLCSKSALFSLKAENANLAEYKVASTQVLGLRVIKDQKIGTSYCESFDQGSLESMVDQALTNARFSKTDPDQDIVVANKERVDGTHEKNFQPDHTSPQKKIELALELEEGVKRKSEHVKNAPYNGFSEVESESYLVNSLGTFCTEKQRSFSCYTSTLIEKDNHQSMHYHYSVARTFAGLDPQNCIDESFLHASKLLEGKPVKTGNYDVIFSTDNLQEFLSCFSNIFSAKAAMNGLNPLADKVGKSIAVKGLNIVDRPRYEHGFNYSSFDDEGNSTKDTVLIKDGILNTLYHNSATAKHFSVENTHNGSRSPKGSLGVGGFQKVISTGNDENIYQGTYLELVSLKGLHSGSDSISGDFSFGASGYLWKDGEIIQPVKGITVSGNFFEALHNINSIGDISKANGSKTFFSPDLRFSGFSIAGN